MDANSITGIVTDPPYGLSFMGKGWDHGIPGTEYWAECLRIAKPGAHLLAFGGTRTFHRLTCAIEDAGWEVRDCISWLYGSGFPKSHNFGKQLGGEWAGFGTALKPAWEPILVCMKPLEGTFAQNAEKHGVAGINVDGCRVGISRRLPHSPSKNNCGVGWITNPGEQPKDWNANKGRWPSNLLLDREAGAMLDQQTGILKSGSGDKHSKTQLGGYEGGFKPLSGIREYSSDSGGASRFFYCPKASSAERNRGEAENVHPCVKPLRLMEYLITLIAPPRDAIILDPFMGSGTTLLAAQNLGIKCIGIEQSADYCEIAKARLNCGSNYIRGVVNG